MEQLIGDIEDEHDHEDLIEDVLEEGRWRFSARLDVEDLNERYGLQLPLNDAYETLGGLLLHHAEEIPDSGFSLPLEGYHLEVEEVSSSKIQTVILHVLEDENY